MVQRIEYDSHRYTSSPSSLRLFNDEGASWVAEWVSPDIPITPGVPVTIVVQGMQENVQGVAGVGGRSLVKPEGWNGEEWVYIKTLDYPSGTFDWSSFELTLTPGVPARPLPEGVSMLRFSAYGGGGTPEKPGVTWFDDLKIYQGGEIIYENKFTEPASLLGKIGTILGPVAFVGIMADSFRKRKQNA